MSDTMETETIEEATTVVTGPATPRSLNAKSIRRRLDKINAVSPEGTGRGKLKKQAKLAETILMQIAAGQIRNPVAAAQAYVSGLAETPATEPAAEA